jgi:uncharacterized membrane protein YeaQ/YmgE (transglycosylase-associated protein family)
MTSWSPGPGDALTALVPFAGAQSRTGARPTRNSEDIMTLQTFLVWIAVGLIAGWLAAAVVGGGFGIIGDIVVGIVGAFLGGFVFRGLHVHVPWGGFPGTVLVAFVGAVILLLILRLISYARYHSP